MNTESMVQRKQYVSHVEWRANHLKIIMHNYNGIDNAMTANNIFNDTYWNELYLPYDALWWHVVALSKLYRADCWN